MWNRYPGGLNLDLSFSPSLSKYPFYYYPNKIAKTKYTAVVMVTKPALMGTTPVIKLLKELAKAPRLSKVR